MSTFCLLCPRGPVQHVSLSCVSQAVPQHWLVSSFSSGVLVAVYFQQEVCDVRRPELYGSC